MINSAGSDADAEAFATAHEGRAYARRTNDPVRRSSRMDMLNNRVGASYGKAYRVDDLSLCSGILAELHAGEKIPVDDDPYAWYDRFGNGQLIWRVLHDKEVGVLIERNGTPCT